MRRSLQYIVLLLLLSSQWAVAQQPEQVGKLPGKQSLQKADTASGPKIYPLELRSAGVGLDLFTIGEGLYSSNKMYFEGQADLNVSRWLFNVAYGNGSFSEEMAEQVLDTTGTAGYSYSNNGQYFRFGVDRNMLSFESPHMIFLGMRYGVASFEEKLAYKKNSYIFGEYEHERTNSSVNASWFEVTAGLRARLSKHLSMGYTVRYKFKPSTSEENAFDVSYIPGFGKNSDTARASFSYYAIFEIPLKKARSLK